MNTMKSNGHATGSQWHTILTGELLLLGMLGKLLYTYPDQDLWTTISDDDLFAEVPFADGQTAVRQGLAHLQTWSRAQKERTPNESLSELQADYTRLFVGPGKVLAPLWESVYYGEERLTFQEETLDVRRWYQRFGLELVNLYHEPDDHIGLELAFLAHLAGKALAALEAGDQAGFHSFLQAQKQFLTGHPLRWVFDWCALVEEQCRTDFYRGIALLTRGALLELRDQVLVDLPIDTIGVTA
jgi:putative dimethyl sulfoxide reductase chaperone